MWNLGEVGFLDSTYRPSAAPALHNQAGGRPVGVRLLSNLHLTWVSLLAYSYLSAPNTHRPIYDSCFEHLGKKNLRFFTKCSSYFSLSNQDSHWTRTESCNNHNINIILG